MRIAHFIQRYPPALGGAEAYFARLSRWLAVRGHDVAVFTSTAVDIENFYSRGGESLPPGISLEDGVEVRRFSLLHVPGQRYFLKAVSLAVPRRWRAYVEPWNPISPSMWQTAGGDRGRFDLVHATAFPYAWPIAAGRRLARRLGVPFVLTPFLHLGDPDDPGDRTRRTYLAPGLLEIARTADRVLVQTEGERQALLACGLAGDQVLLQGMGVDLASCTGGNRMAARAAWGCTANEIVVGHLANNSKEKGTIDLCEAANLAWQRGGRFTLVLAGPQTPAFRAFWSQYRPLGPVHRLGPLDEAGKRDFFTALDLFALPSRSDSFGIVLLEAWAGGNPVVVYRAGGPASLVRDGIDGLQARCGDMGQLAEAILRLVADEPLRRRLGAAGQARLRDFQWEDKLAMVEQVYRELTGK